MRKELKDIIEELVISSIRDFKENNSLNPKRIVLYTSYKLQNQTLVFNYTQNRFYNQQHIIDKKIPIKIIPFYKKKGYRGKGDYIVDVGGFLEQRNLKMSAFVDF